ncbi:membrane progestin receptor gamma-like [Pollicipes pollicipes]|nr:membrane progestin receptor gamma-like [Pollicipes pollicipes]
MLRYSVIERLTQTSSVIQQYMKRRSDDDAGARKIRLLSVHEVADVHKEPGIISGYVPHGSPWVCVRGLFLATNETINFWTHFLPSLYFIWKLAELRHSLDFSDSYTWPYICYMLTTCVYPFVSCVAHAFSSMSVRAAHVGFFIDYAAISIFSYGVGVLYRSYCFPKDLLGTVYSDYFIHVCFVNTIVCTFLACRSRFLQRSFWQKRTRLLAFLVPYAWDNVPLLYRLLTCAETRPWTPCRPSDALHLRQVAASMLGSFFYGTHLPERMAPGTFDIIGHSHNFLHILGIVATNEQMNGARLDMDEARAPHHPDGVDLDLWATWGGLLAVAINMLIVAVSVVAMSRKLGREKNF